MTDSVHDLRDTVIPKSDQLNAEDLLSGPLTVRIEAVKRASGKDQPIAIGLDGGLRPFLPCKTVRRILIAAWGNDGRAWVGRSMRLFRDPEVAYGGVKVGGIRVSHLSNIDKPMALMLATTRGKRSEFSIEPLPTEVPAPNGQAAKPKAAPNPDVAFLKSADQQIVTDTRASLFPSKPPGTPLTHAETKQLADAVRKNVPPEPATVGDYDPISDTQ